MSATNFDAGPLGGIRDGGSLTMSVEGSPDRVVIHLHGELDTMGRLRFREQIRSMLGRGGSEVVIDVSDLGGIDVAGLAALLRADLLLRGVHSRLYVEGARPAFVELLRSTGLEGRLQVAAAEPAGRATP
ncbi:MAG: STAS domain-containing protein [Frankia sp.]